MAIEADGSGDAPTEIRDAIIAEAGEWALHQSQSSFDPVRLAKSLRTVLKLTLPEALALAKNAKVPLFRGTRAEVEWVGQALQNEGVDPTAYEIHPT